LKINRLPLAGLICLQDSTLPNISVYSVWVG